MWNPVTFCWIHYFEDGNANQDATELNTEVGLLSPHV